MTLIMLAQEAFVGELGPIGESGVECTRLASLSIDERAAPVRAYVKMFATTNGEGAALRGLVNEVAGYFCAKAAELPVAPRAGLIVLDGSMLSDPPEWMRPGSLYVGWWTEDVGYPSIKATFKWDALPAGSMVQLEALAEIRATLLKYPGTPSIIALDDLIANIDRNLGNILCVPHGLSLIDHGHCLTGPAWTATDLIPDSTYRNVVKAILGADGETLPYKSSIMAAYVTIAGRVVPKLPELEALMGHLVIESDASAASTFLQLRSAPPSAARRVGVVA